ncbi:hypothetical protein GGE65_004564 [Skermanella aerolata]
MSVIMTRGDLENNFIHVPLVAEPGQPTTDDVGELLAKLECRLAYLLVADLNTPEREH